MEGYVKSDLIDVEVRMFSEKPLAILVSEDGTRANAVWLPKSQVEFHQIRPGIYTVTMPGWLAEEKGLA